MINKYITATFLAVASIGNISSQNVRPVPKLVVNIAIDQLRTDYIEAFIPYYSEGGIKKLLRNGAVYSNAQYMFSSSGPCIINCINFHWNISIIQWNNKDSDG